LEAVSDRELQSALSALLASSSRTEARIIAHLAELEERRIHLKAGSESLFAYCTKRLGLSNNEAFHRIAAARVARKFPVVFTLLEQRALHLTAVCLLREYLTPDNHAELFAQASHKTKWQIQELIARRFPRPDVESRIRKLPAPRLMAENRGAGGLVAGSSPATGDIPVRASPTATSPISPVFVSPAPARAALSVVPVSPPLVAALPPRPLPASAPTLPVRGLVEPTSESRYRIQLNASSALKEKLELLRALTSHANPEGDLAVLIERAVDVALEQVQRQRFAKTERPRQASARCMLRAQGKARKRGHIPNETQREIAARDELRCTYVGEGGHRCEARAFLQMHHEHPWARGGEETPGNLRLLCASHNKLLATQDFGVAHVATRITARREQSAQRPEGR
jgi:5-methylcytosine-specific restriction endonuclease McrA